MRNIKPSRESSLFDGIGNGDIKQCGVFEQGSTFFLLGCAKNVSGDEDVELENSSWEALLYVCMSNFFGKREIFTWMKGKKSRNEKIWVDFGEICWSKSSGSWILDILQWKVSFRTDRKPLTITSSFTLSVLEASGITLTCTCSFSVHVSMNNPYPNSSS